MQLLSSGTCGCLGYDLTRGDDYKIVMAELSYAEFFLGSHSEDVQRRVVELICSGTYVTGDIDVVSEEGCTHIVHARCRSCLLYTSPSPRDLSTSRMPSSA